MLEQVKHTCDEHGVRLLFVYFPAYSQIYDPTASTYINQLLDRACAGLKVDFVDLTEAFRAGGRGEVLHLAPLDFHPNPRGYQVFAAAIAEHLRAAAPWVASNETAGRSGSNPR